ncbi:MAG: hypothetical protein R3A10_05690 [Caldilineaceae bacterium]
MASTVLPTWIPARRAGGITSSSRPKTPEALSVAGAAFVVDWGRRPDENPGYTVTNAQGEGDYPDYRHDLAAQRHRLRHQRRPARRTADGMGLPNNEQVA